MGGGTLVTCLEQEVGHYSLITISISIMARITRSIYQLEDHVIVSLSIIEKKTCQQCFLQESSCQPQWSEMLWSLTKMILMTLMTPVILTALVALFKKWEWFFLNDNDETFPSFWARPTPRCVLSLQTIWLKCPAGKTNKPTAFSSYKYFSSLSTVFSLLSSTSWYFFFFFTE